MRDILPWAMTVNEKGDPSGSPSRLGLTTFHRPMLWP